MGNCKVIMPDENESKYTFGDMKEDDWFIDSGGDLCCKYSDTKFFINKENNLHIYGNEPTCQCDKDSIVTPVSVEIIVTYDK